MKLRAFKPLRDAGASWAEIARAPGCDWRTAKKYLEADTSTPPSYGPRPSRGKIIDPHRDVIDAWLRADVHLKASVIHERLAADPYRFAGHYQRVKEYVRGRRPEKVLGEHVAPSPGQCGHRGHDVDDDRAQADQPEHRRCRSSDASPSRSNSFTAATVLRAVAGKADAPPQAPATAPAIAAIVSVSPPSDAARLHADHAFPPDAVRTANAAGTDSWVARLVPTREKIAAAASIGRSAATRSQAHSIRAATSAFA